MIISVTIEDIIKRCLFSDYKRFVLKNKSEQEIQIIVKENKPIVLSENEAYAIGLLKCIETDNLVHRFIVHMKEMINIKSTIFDKNVYISVKIIENELESFKKRFPEYWEADLAYAKGISDLNEFITKLQNLIKTFEIFEFKIKDKKVRYFQSKDIKKMIEDDKKKY
jgi:hypothetical protein